MSATAFLVLVRSSGSDNVDSNVPRFFTLTLVVSGSYQRALTFVCYDRSKGIKKFNNRFFYEFPLNLSSKSLFVQKNIVL